jgi:hypothetical protein
VDGRDVAYEPLGYTLVLGFARGDTGFAMSFEFRNECGDGFSGPHTDNDIGVRRASFDLPIAIAGPRYAGGAGNLTVDSANGALVVEQRHGQGTPWQRRARIRSGDRTLEEAVSFAAPFLAVPTAAGAAALQLGWMQYREPQALAVEGNVLSMRVIGEDLNVGEARGIWNHARVTLLPGGEVSLAALEAARARGRAEIERGLLVRTPRATLNDAQVFPSLGDDLPSTVKERYLDYMNTLHQQTAGPQWELAKTYGSQVWPDTPAFAIETPNPSNNLVEMNYWNGSRNELLEYLRRGDLKWAWDWALPQTWTQFFSAYANYGDNMHTNRNGYALTGSGCGADDCDDLNNAEDTLGHWNRSGHNSNDYTYTHGDIAYIVRPTYAMMHRFSQQGLTGVERYMPGGMDEFVDARHLFRLQVQHWVLLANCAEFVPGADGQACHDRLLDIMTELSRDNFSAGVLCELDEATGVDCVAPQQFFQNALMLPFFHRLYRNYGDVGGNLKRLLADSMWHFYLYGMGTDPASRPANKGDPQRPEIGTSGTSTWTNTMAYRLTPDRSAVAACSIAPIGQPQFSGDSGNFSSCALHPDTDLTSLDFIHSEDHVLYPNRAQTVGLLLMAQQIDPNLDVCAVGRQALDDREFLDYWYDYSPDGGWTKGPAQVMQSMAFALGGYDACATPRSEP